jgi:heme-binding NEAT domain protein
MASLIKKPVNDVGTSELNTSPRINKNHGTVVRKKIKKPHTLLPAGGFTMEASVISDGSNCTAFVQKAT